MEILDFLERNGIRWQPVRLRGKMPICFSDGRTKPDPSDMRRMTPGWENIGKNAGLPVLSDETLRERQQQFFSETDYIWLDTTVINVLDVDHRNARSWARGLPYANSVNKNLPHAFVVPEDPDQGKKTIVQVQRGKVELLCGQVCIQKKTDIVYNIENNLSKRLGLAPPEDSPETYIQALHLIPESTYASARALRAIAEACINLGIDKGELEHLVPDENPYRVQDVWASCSGATSHGLGTLKYYNPEDQLRHAERFEEWREMFEADHFKIKRKGAFATETEAGVDLFDPSTFVMSEAQNGVEFVKRWVNKGEVCRVYQDIDYCPPPKLCASDDYNVWRPFWWEGHSLPGYVTGQNDEEGVNIFEFEELLKICAGDSDEGSWPCLNLLRGFLGQLITEPGFVPHKIPIIFSEQQGIGKNTLMLELMGRVLGENKLAHVTGLQGAFPRFSTPRAMRLLVVADECSSKNSNNAKEAINAHATGPTVKMEHKHQHAYHVKNACRVVMLTNKRDCLNVTQNDRRYVMFQARYVPTREFFNAVHEKLNSTRHILAFIAYLQDHALTLQQLQEAQAPATSIQRDFFRSSEGNELMRWLADKAVEKKENNKLQEEDWSHYEIFRDIMSWAATKNDYTALNNKLGNRNELKVRVSALRDSMTPAIRNTGSRNNNRKTKLVISWPTVYELVKEQDLIE